MRGPGPSHPQPHPYARRKACGPPPLARRWFLNRRRFTLDDPDSSSIAGRRASGFLQVSLSKVTRHLHRGTTPATRAESPPMNANDYSGPIATKRAHRRRCPRTSAAFRFESRLASQVRSPGRQAAYRKNH
jgi:hypothetical protein